jgi:hypothetical protein
MARTQASFSQAHLQASAVTSWIVQNARMSSEAPPSLTCRSVVSFETKLK